MAEGGCINPERRQHKTLTSFFVEQVPLESGKGNKLQTGPDPISLTKRVQWAGDESGALSAMEFKPFRIISGCPTEKGKAPPEIEWLVQVRVIRVQQSKKKL